MANSIDGVQWSDLEVKSCISTHVAKSNQIVNNAADLIETLGTVAGLLKAADQDEQLTKVRQAAQELLKSRQDMQLHHEALKELEGPTGYHATGNATDFAAQLTSRAATLAARTPYVIEKDPLMLRFEQLARAGFEEEQIDEDIAIAGGPELTKNMKCPITLKQVMDLQEPVQDKLGFVYEKSAIVEYINKRSQGNRRPCPCPVAGTSHTVTVAELRVCAGVVAEKKKAARGQGQGTQGATQEDTEFVTDL